ncbi:MAG: T9SS type A sorting domain-containing protein [Flavobacterium sp.]|nr:MAG: T9SS type A sorting domain-containing protein [Flavobacterium sp.]
MKKITLLLTTFFSFSAFAQITFTSNDFATAGEEFTVSTANASMLNFASTGANYNWDYSSLTAASQATTGWANPNNAGYKLSWCLSHFYLFTCNSQFNSNFKLASPVMNDINIGNYTISNIVEHTNVTPSGVANKMRGMTTEISGIPLPLTIDYDDPDELYNLPMVYNDSYTNTGHFALDLSNMGVDFTYALSTTRTNTVQGWGSLTTPMGTFPNVLKIKCVTQRTDAVTVAGITIPIPTTTISYQWFSKDHGIPVLQADGIELFNFFIPTTVKYLDEQQCLTAASDFSYIPTADFNEETMMGTMAFTNLSENYNSVSWDFGDGTTGSTEVNPTHFYKCPGTYSVTLTVNNSVCAPNSTSTVVHPVVVTDTQNVMTTGVTVNETSLTADRDATGTTYQWVDCNNANAPIEGATGQTFSPTASGSYACMLDTGGCTGMSECKTFNLLGNGQFNMNNVQLYPNPTTGLLHLSGNLNVKSVEVYNMLGMKVAKSLDISPLASGMYLVKVDTDAGMLVRKIMKK